MATMTKDQFLQIPGMQARIEQLAKKHGFTVDEMLYVIQRESNFDPAGRNPDGGATGLIQFYGDLYKEDGKVKVRDYKTINGKQYKLNDIREMSALEQMELIDEYFVENHKKGEDPYITVALPKAKNMDMDTIIGGPNDSIAKQNPQWVNEDGNVTKRSILNYGSLDKGKKYSGEKKEAKTEKKDDEYTYEGPKEVKGKGRQTRTVLGPDGQKIEIEIGEDVTEYEIRDKQTGGEQRFKSWKELEDNINNFDKSRPFYIDQNRYKWNEEKKKVLLVDEKGEYLPEDRQVINEDFQNIFRGPDVEFPGGKKQGQTPKETVEKKIISPPEIKIQEVESVSDTEKKVEPVVADDIKVDETEKPDLKSRIQGLGNAGRSLLQGAAAIVDGIGGPGAIISAIMGKKGLKAAMKQIEPQAMPELSPSFMEHLRQTKELSKKGFHPAEEMKFRKELDKTYQIGLENAVRGSGGQRAKFLAQSGVLDAQRSAALLDYAVADDELQRKNQDKYEKMMLFKENFDIQRTDKQRTEDMERQIANKKAAADFTSAALTNVFSSLNKIDVSGLVNKFLGPQSGGLTVNDPASPFFKNQNVEENN